MREDGYRKAMEYFAYQMTQSDAENDKLREKLVAAQAHVMRLTWELEQAKGGK